jgi:hypothetical protein
MQKPLRDRRYFLAATLKFAMPTYNVTLLMTQGRDQAQSADKLFFQDMWRKGHACAGKKLREST